MSASKNIYTDSPNPIAINRINYDRKLINDNNNVLDNEGIYFHFPRDDNKTVSTHYYQLLIGPENSPYEYGFYVFKGQFPDNYPFKPMTMKSLTQGGNVRKHPNFYVCGKCCFSFLGTWSGPPWTPCQNSKNVAMSMRSVMTKYPLENEPGWENINSRRTSHEQYAKLIAYFNIKYAVVNILSNIETQFTYFKEPVIRNFIKNYQKYINIVNNLALKDQYEHKSPVYSFAIYVDKKLLISKLQSLYNKYSTHKELDKKTDSCEINNNNLTSQVVNTESFVNTESIVNKPLQKKVSSKPKESASLYEKGYTCITKDNISYRVIEYKRGDKIQKRWCKCKS